MTDRTARQSASRAELLREKRQQPSRVPVMPSKREVPEPVKKHKVINPLGRSGPQAAQQPQQGKRAAVITSRPATYSTPLRETVATPARRKVYRVSANGVETRLPALPALRFSWQWVSGFLTVVLVTVILLMIYLPEFEVSKVEVTGLERVTMEDVQTVVFNNTGSIFLLDPQKVVNAVAITFPELSDIKFSMDMKGIVTLSATERVPVLSWFAGDYYYWIDSEGVLMTPRGEGIPPMSVQSTTGIPLIKAADGITSPVDFINTMIERKQNPLTPEETINIVDPKVLSAALELGSKMPSGAGLFYDHISGMGWQDSRGWKVFFGLDLENFEFQQVEYQTIVNYLSENGITPTMINVEHVDAPVFKTK